MRLGSDPEVFLLSETGKHLAINGYINADKHHPMQIPAWADGFTLQEDNVALEYGIPPASTAEEFAAHITKVMEKSLEWLPAGVTFSKLSCTIFEEDQLQHPMSRVFGCEPDYCAYTSRKNPRPRPPHPGMRSAGGHIHVETTVDPLQVVTNMDLLLAVPSVMMDAGKERKQLYGKAGAFRFKPYGVEYRTLSNFWIFNPTLIHWVWRNTERALGMGQLSKGVKEKVRNCINGDDQQLADELRQQFDLEVL